MAASFDEFSWVLFVEQICQWNVNLDIEKKGLTVTTVSLAPASPPARMLVSVEVFCFLVMIVQDVQKTCGVRKKGTTLMNIHIYTNLLISCHLLGWSWLPTNSRKFSVDSTLRSPLRGRIRRWDVGSGCIHFAVETSTFPVCSSLQRV